MKKMYKVTGLWLEVNQYLKNKKNNFHMKSGNFCSKQMCQVAWSFLYTENPLTTFYYPLLYVLHIEHESVMFCKSDLLAYTVEM